MGGLKCLSNSTPNRSEQSEAAAKEAIRQAWIGRLRRMPMCMAMSESRAGNIRVYPVLKSPQSKQTQQGYVQCTVIFQITAILEIQIGSTNKHRENPCGLHCQVFRADWTVRITLRSAENAGFMVYCQAEPPTLTDETR